MTAQRQAVRFISGGPWLLTAAVILGCTGGADVSAQPIQPDNATIDILFQDGFESGSLAAWDDIYDNGLKAGQAARLTVVSTSIQSGSYALSAYYPAITCRGSMSKFFMPGYDLVRASVWFRPAAGWAGSANLFLLRGSSADNQWLSIGTAGLWPSGTNFFITALACDVRDGMRFYTYFVGQSQYAGGICYGRNGLQSGVHTPAIYYDANRFPTVDAWHLLELEVVLNTPGQPMAIRSSGSTATERANGKRWSSARVTS